MMQLKEQFWDDLDQVRYLSGTVGRYDPNLYCLDMNKIPDENELKKLPISHSMFMSSLVHERTHWMQFMGTSTGLFLSLLSTIQNDRIKILTENSTQLDLPLIKNKSPDIKRGIPNWRSYEWLYFAIYGGLRDTIFESLPRPHLASIFKDIFQSIRQSVESIPYLGVDSTDWEWNNPYGNFEKLPLLRTQQNELFGAKHLMETGARVSEFLQLSRSIAIFYPGYTLESSQFFSGIYGEAFEVFRKISGAPISSTNSSMIALAIACDYGLQVPFPPVVGSDVFIEQIKKAQFPLPWTLFASAAHKLSKVDLTRNIDLSDYEAVKKLHAECITAIGDLWDIMSVGKYPLLKLFNGIDPLVPLIDYMTNSTGHPIPISSVDIAFRNLGYFTNLRTENPMACTIPGYLYSFDRSIYHNLLDPVRIPMQAFMGGPWIPTPPASADASMYSVLILQSLLNKIFRWIVYLPYPRVLDRLRTLALKIHPEEGVEIVRKILLKAEIIEKNRLLKQISGDL